MATEILLVKAGMTMTEGTVAEWYVADGATVEAGQLLYRMETEKIELDVEAEAAGIVRQGAPAGTKTTPGALIGYILAPGEALPGGFSTVAAPAQASAGGAVPSPAATPVTLAGGRIPASPIARRLARETGIALADITGSGPGGRITEADVMAVKTAAKPVSPPTAGVPPVREIMASPLARRLAERLGVDLRFVSGSGPGGRITQEDVEGAAASAQPASPSKGARPGQAAPGDHRAGDRIPIRGMRKVIAERMHGSLQQMAQLTMGMDVAMDEVVKLRGQLIDEWAPEGIRPSYTDLIIKAVAKALTRHPLLNATMHETEIELIPEVHIGMAVAVPGGLVVPVIRDASRRPLKEIAADSSRFAEAARNGTLALDDMAGGTFSITALGMAGVDFFTPVINPPNVAILGAGRIHESVGWDGERPVKRQTMTLSLTIDHRAVDGAPGAAFLGAVREYLEAPYRLLI